MIIKDAKYFKDPITEKNVMLIVNIDGENLSVPLDEENRHYAEILRQVKAGTLTIEDAD